MSDRLAPQREDNTHGVKIETLATGISNSDAGNRRPVGIHDRERDRHNLGREQVQD